MSRVVRAMRRLSRIPARCTHGGKEVMGSLATATSARSSHGVRCYLAGRRSSALESHEGVRIQLSLIVLVCFTPLVLTNMVSLVLVLGMGVMAIQEMRWAA